MNRKGSGGIGQIEVDTALVEHPNHLFLRQAARFPAAAPHPHVNPCIAQCLDDLTPIAVGLTYKGNVVNEGQVQLAVKEVVACPLALDDIAVAQPFVLRKGAFGRGDYPVEARRPIAGEVVKTPVIIAEPVKGDRVVVLRDLPDDSLVQLVGEEHAEEQIRLLPPGDLQQVAIHPVSAMLLHEGHEVEVKDLVAHVEQGMVEVIVLEAVSLLRLPIVVFHCHIKYEHAVSVFLRS